MNYKHKSKWKARTSFGFITIIAVLVLALVGCPSPAGNNGTDTGPYTITMQTQGSGTATASPNPAEEGDVVTITATPNDGYDFDKWAVVSGAVTLSSTTAETATFTMPAGAVTIRAEFEALPPNTPSLSFIPAVAGSGGAFGEVEYGYTQPDAHIINLHNHGTGTATIASWSIDDVEDAFEVTGTDTTPTITIHADHEITVQPKADLAPGVYNAEITVTYDEGKTAILNLSFIVTALPINAAAVTVTAPVTGATPEEATTVDPNFSVTAINWNPDDNPFKGITQYTVQITLTANTGYTFAGTTFTPQISGTTTGVTVVGTRGETLVMTRQYTATAPAFGVGKAGTTYTITEAQEGFSTVQGATDHIRDDAGGGDVTIQFGNGTDFLIIGLGIVSFNNDGGTWGHVTLTGNISSSNTTSTQGTIVVANNVVVTSTAVITNTANNDNARAIYHNSTGNLNITGGNVLATSAGRAIHIANTGLVTISGENTLIRSNNGTATGGTIVLGNADAQLHMTGGKVENTSNSANTDGRVIHNVSSNHDDAVIISGGMVEGSGTGSNAIINAANGVIHIRDTAIITSRAYNGTIVLASGSARLNMTGGTVYNTASQGGTVISNASSTHDDAIIISGGTVGAVTDLTGNTGTDRMAISNSANGTGNIHISGADTLITSASNTLNQGVIRLHSTTSKLTIESGTVENTSNGANAHSITINGEDYSRVTIEDAANVTPLPAWLQ